MNKPIPNVSRALTLIALHECGESFAHADVRAWGAPSECHDDVERGVPQRWRAVTRHVRGITGLRWGVFVRRLRDTYGLSLESPRWGRIVDRVYEQQDYPF